MRWPCAASRRLCACSAAWPAAWPRAAAAHVSAACRAQGWLFAYNAATLQQVGAHAGRSACWLGPRA